MILCRIHQLANAKLEESVKGPFCDPNMLFLWQRSVGQTWNKLVSKFSVNSEILFVTYARFTVSVTIGHYYVGISMLWHEKYTNLVVILSSKEICKKYFQYKHYVPKGFYWYKNLNLFGEKWGAEAVDHEIDL